MPWGPFLWLVVSETLTPSSFSLHPFDFSSHLHGDFRSSEEELCSDISWNALDTTLFLSVLCTPLHTMLPPFHWAYPTLPGPFCRPCLVHVALTQIPAQTSLPLIILSLTLFQTHPLYFHDYLLSFSQNRFNGSCIPKNKTEILILTRHSSSVLRCYPHHHRHILLTLSWLLPAWQSWL